MVNNLFSRIKTYHFLKLGCGIALGSFLYNLKFCGLNILVLVINYGVQLFGIPLVKPSVKLLNMKAFALAEIFE